MFLALEKRQIAQNSHLDNLLLNDLLDSVLRKILVDDNGYFEITSNDPTNPIETAAQIGEGTYKSLVVDNFTIGHWQGTQRSRIKNLAMVRAVHRF